MLASNGTKSQVAGGDSTYLDSATHGLSIGFDTTEVFRANTTLTIKLPLVTSGPSDYHFFVPTSEKVYWNKNTALNTACDNTAGTNSSAADMDATVTGSTSGLGSIAINWPAAYDMPVLN